MDDYYESLCKYDDESVKKYMIEDFDFTTWYVYNKESSLCKFAVSIFIFNNLINEKLILKHEPFDLWTLSASVWAYDDLISRFDFLKYSVGKAVIMLKYDVIYFHNDFLPEWELFSTAAKYSNKEVYKDQLWTAKKYGCFFKILDMDNEKVLGDYEKVEIKELPFEDCEVDY